MEQGVREIEEQYVHGRKEEELSEECERPSLYKSFHLACVLI